MECFERGLITDRDTGGVDLSWGNADAVVELARQIARAEGFGAEVLGDGAEKAAEKIGAGARRFAMHCGGEELLLHDPRFYPGIGASYTVAPAAGHHTEFGSWFVEKSMILPRLGHRHISDKYTYSGKGPAHKYLSCFGQVVNSAGWCFFAANISPAGAVPAYLSMVMGRPVTMEEVLIIGERIVSLRTAFNLREGIQCVKHNRLPDRVLGRPPLTGGPTRGVTVDNETQIREYFEAMGWNPETGIPARECFTRLGLDFAMEVTG